MSMSHVSAPMEAWIGEPLKLCMFELNWILLDNIEMDLMIYYGKEYDS
jgi:hypothetical protein